MKKQIFSEQNMLSLSREAIHLFLTKRTEKFLEYLSDEFVWIGDYDNLYMRGKEQFAETIFEETELPPVNILEEEYSVLSHEKNLWVTYGRCTVCSEMPEVPPMSTKFHFTFIWRTDEERPLLIEAMACHTMASISASGENISQSKVFKETLRYKQATKAAVSAETKKIIVKELNRAETNYLLLSEVLYIKADNKSSIIYAVNKKITTGMTLNEFDDVSEFIRIHRSYLVNRAYVDKVRHYTITLTDGTELPISRYIYSDVKKYFSDK